MKTAEVKPSDDDPKAAGKAAAPVETRATPPPPPSDVLPEYPDIGQGDQVVTLIGVGDPAEPSQVRIGCPLPQSITIGGVPYDLSDRAKGIYTFRHK